MKEESNFEVFRYENKENGYYVKPPYTKWIEGSSDKETKIQITDLETIIQNLLLTKNCKVEEYKDGVLVKQGYPGNWMDFTDLCLDHRLPPSLCSVKISKSHVEICFIRTTESTFYTCSIEDDDVYSNLYAVLSEINAFEIIYDDKNLVSLESTGIITHLCEKANSAIDLLKKFLKVEVADIKTYVRPNICIVDYNTLEALDIYSKEKCILDQFQCYTVQGKRLLLQFFKQPLRNKEEIEARLNIIEKIRMLDLEILREFPDILKITKKISKISLLEILKLHQVVGKIPNLLDKINYSSLQSDFYIPLTNINSRVIMEDIEKVIDIKKSQRNIVVFNTVQKNEGDLSLQIISELYKSLDKINAECNSEYRKLLDICDKIKYEEGDDNFRITRIEYKKAENALQRCNILIINILKSGVNFTTKRMSELTLEKNNVKESINKETCHILNELRLKMKTYVNELEVLNYIVALLDVFHAIGKKSKDFGYTRPTFINPKTNKDSNIVDDDVFIEIKGGIHPLLEDKDCISNDIYLNKKRLCVITGPNMGGKSTYLKMIGVISILAQVGCYVPAKYARLPIFDGVYIRIGANDCTYKGSSTFMVEMKDISRICRMSTEESLILIDELGRGTSEIDGISIAKAVKDYLHEKRCITLFATHFPELCDDRSLNMKASFDQLILNYKIVEGICDTSWGLNVAKMVGFPESVIEDIEKGLEQ
ncbi:DNA mismatch repair protein MSH2 [Vairimorpha necatrix]|uniref:DNA mismatch repair protein MSH2 n=1 Tax=Vairimorpha necatrix TaxID=6039 RepID=A0AAX4JFV8_9MICR